MGNSKARIAIIEDHVLFAEALEIALEREGYDVRRVLLPRTGNRASQPLAAVLRLKPAVVLLDLDLREYGNGARMVQPLVRAGTSVIVVTGSTSRSDWGEALAFGARKVLPKNSHLNEILATVRRVLTGLPVLTHVEREELLRAWHDERHEMAQARERLERLTRREAEVLAHLIDGRQVKEIARLAVVSEATVRTQVKAILAKLEVSSQVSAVSVARKAGWETPGGRPTAPLP